MNGSIVFVDVAMFLLKISALKKKSNGGKSGNPSGKNL